MEQSKRERWRALLFTWESSEKRLVRLARSSDAGKEFKGAREEKGSGLRSQVKVDSGLGSYLTNGSLFSYQVDEGRRANCNRL